MIRNKSLIISIIVSLIIALSASNVLKSTRSSAKRGLDDLFADHTTLNLISHNTLLFYCSTFLSELCSDQAAIVFDL